MPVFVTITRPWEPLFMANFFNSRDWGHPLYAPYSPIRRGSVSCLPAAYRPYAGLSGGDFVIEIID